MNDISTNESVTGYGENAGVSSIYVPETGDVTPAASCVAGLGFVRDPADSLTISSLLRALVVLLAALTASVGINVYLSLRRADRIVIDKASARVVELNNRDYGATERVEISPDRPNDSDKKYLVKEFLKALYQVEQSTREKEINKLLRMLDADLSLAFANRLSQNNLLVTERAESLNSSWDLQDLSIDERDPYVLRALGTRRMRRKAGGADVEESVQLKVKFLLKDSSGSPVRNDNNLRTGFTILRFRVEPVSGKTSSPVALIADGDLASTPSAATGDTTSTTSSAGN